MNILGQEVNNSLPRLVTILESSDKRRIDHSNPRGMAFGTNLFEGLGIGMSTFIHEIHTVPRKKFFIKFGHG
jgi:hypothetical protein